MSNEEANARAQTREKRLRALEQGLIAAGWTPLEDAAEVKPCDACTRPSTSLHNYAGDAICGACEALFTAANALFDNGVTDEVELIGTLAFTRYAPDSTPEAANKYGRFEVVRVADGVPVLRLRKVAINVHYYEGSRIVRAVNVEVFSRYANPGEVSAVYEQTLVEHGIHEGGWRMLKSQSESVRAAFDERVREARERLGDDATAYTTASGTQYISLIDALFSRVEMLDLLEKAKERAAQAVTEKGE